MFRPCCLFLLIIRQEEHTAYVGLRVCGYFRERPEFEFLEAELEVGTEAVSFLESPVRKGELKSAWVWDKAEQGPEHWRVQFQLDPLGSHRNNGSQLEASSWALDPLTL